MNLNTYYKRKNSEEKPPMNILKSTQSKPINTNPKYITPQKINLSQDKDALSYKRNNDGHTTYTIYNNNSNEMYAVVNSLSKKVSKISNQNKTNMLELEQMKPIIENHTSNLSNLKQIVNDSNKNLEDTKQNINQKFIEIQPYMDIGNTIFSKLPVYYELDDLTKSLDKPIIDYTRCSYGYSKTYNEVNKIHRISVLKNINKIFVTLIGGGGAGGLGYITNNYYYSGGGGGSGAYARRIPLKVSQGHFIIIKVGKGGDLSKNMDGSDSSIEIVNNGGHVLHKIIANGGKNAHPLSQDDISVKGGAAGINTGAYFRNGTSGNDGSVSLPSQTNVYGGDGADSGFASGGLGGGKIIGDDVDFIGSDGSYGSGGGGSAPRTNIDSNGKLSGNGGDGFIMIEFSD
ncbi:hypothetical protein QKU48_gp1106 [Fadolivirus algeromassiliense]|jgi:hypothetical protein|uniref:Glycine-rich domain-containing protein n=1 Tax=Fadolivirus FV1/VV64 TaxID=3070911 RepID=A0A7D3QVR0_9VIRU|nr:hypothetical protein QKU48_gp1106 [Fadolivirus algeromassiliense]QKF94564.1 hypothetical protein Fadolivirus_1_1106 [Fadolivirus FV1/VV64]